MLVTAAIRIDKTTNVASMDRPAWVTNEQHWHRSCREVVERCRDLMEGRLSVIEAARVLRELAFRVRAEEDPDFILFRAIDSESDALPIGPEREHWSTSALEREDSKIAAFEETWRSRALLSARNLTERYAWSSNTPEDSHQ
jgi:hypothetical protein